MKELNKRIYNRKKTLGIHMISTKSNLLFANNGPYYQSLGAKNTFYKSEHAQILEISSDLYRFNSQLRTIMINNIYKKVNVPNHAFLLNTKKTKVSNKLINAYFFIIKDNKFYPPSWYNINENGTICLGLAKRKIKTIEDLVSYFWQSKFSEDLTKPYYNLNITNIENVNLQSCVPQIFY